MGVTLTSPRPSHGSLNWDSTLESDLAGLAAGINAAAPADGVDFNAIGTSGIYLGGSATNAPGNSSQSFFVWANRFNSTNQAQIAINQTTAEVWTRKEQAGAWSAWRKVVDSSADTGWVTGSSTGIVAASGWTISAQRYRIVNGIVYAGFVLTKTGSATATANAAGVIGVIGGATMPSGLIPAQSNGDFGSVGSGSTVAATGYVNATGAFQIAGLAPSQSVPVGGVLDFMGSYAL